MSARDRTQCRSTGANHTLLGELLLFGRLQAAGCERDIIAEVNCSPSTDRIPVLQYVLLPLRTRTVHGTGTVNLATSKKTREQKNRT